MKIVMRKATQFKTKFYGKHQPYTAPEDVSNEVARRWIKRRIAVLDTRTDEQTKAKPGPEPKVVEPVQEPIKVKKVERLIAKPKIVTEPTAPTEAPEPTKLKDLSLTGLRKAAKEMGITGIYRLSKKDLMEKINGHNNTGKG